MTRCFKLPALETLMIFLNALLIVALLGLSNLAQAMSFEKQERCVENLQPKCQLMILAIGQINKESANQFKSIAPQLPRGTWVALSSPGGNLLAGMQLGLAIREAGFNTTIGSNDYSPPSCLSSCAYAFAGGVLRRLPAGSTYGIHQFRGNETELSSDSVQKITTVLAKYLDAMGIDRRLLDSAQMTTSDKVAVLSLAQAQLYKVDNTGQSAYPRWRIEALPDGKLLTVNNLTNQKNQLVTIGLMPVDKSIACFIYYKTDDAPSFSGKTVHHLIVAGKEFNLLPLETWQVKAGGFQSIFNIPNAALEALVSAPEDTTITLIGDFVQPPKGTSSTPLELYFGLGNFKTTLTALIKRSAL